MKATPSASGKVLVTGGTGFLGKKIVERLLDQGRAVSVLARHKDASLEARGVRFHQTSLTDRDAVRKACEGVSTIFHVAAKVGVWGPYHSFFETNVLGTRAIIDAAKDAGVSRIVYTSSPSVVYNGEDLSGVDESLPLTTKCPSAYPLTKAIAEGEIIAANSQLLKTVALRPHLIWGIGDPHLVPRLIARHDRLRIVGTGKNLVDMVHVDNAVDAHLLAETAVDGVAAGKSYFITNGEPVLIWEWINALFVSLGKPPITKKISLSAASKLGTGLEWLWKVLPLSGEPPMTRFIAAELAKEHWFSLDAARRDLGYQPRVSMADGTASLVAFLKSSSAA